MDYNLLRLLEGDCTLSKKQLAAMVGTSADRVEETIQEYEKAGIIQGYKAVIDWDATDRQDVTALIEVKVEPQRDDGFDRVAERIYQYEEVESCYLMSGDFDMTVIISGRSLQEVARFVSQKLSTIDAVKSTATHFILKKYKANGIIYDNPNTDDRQAIIL